MSHPKTKPAPEASSGAFQKLYLHHTFPPARAGQSVGRLLREALGLSPSFIAHLKFLPEGICLDGQPAHTDTLVRAGQLLSLRIDDGPAQNPAAPMAAPLDILWEDEFLVIVNKAPGMVVHGPERPGLPPTLANAAAFHWGPEQPFHPVQRLDRGTSGLLVLAKCRLVHERLQKQLHSDSFSRRYLAVTSAVPTPPSGTIELPIVRLSPHGTRRTAAPHGQSARTDYEVLSQNGRQALVALSLHSGRTHQIRVHMQALGCPLVGDKLYGGPGGLDRPALHSRQLSLRHPISGESLSFTAPLPEDMTELIRHLSL